MLESSAPRDMLGRSRLTKVAAAQSLLLSEITKLKPDTEILSINQALDRIGSEQIISPEDLPGNDRSTMDGFAVVAADTFGASQSMPAYLDLSGEVIMGALSDGSVSRGKCYKIPTGGLLPVGADAIVMHEHTVPVDDQVIEIIKGVGTGTNVIRRGDDIGKGEIAIDIGRRLRPQDLGLLAGLGIVEIEVFKPIMVGIVSTGDEIIDYRDTPQPGKIRNINSIVINGLCKRYGAEVCDYGIVADDESTFFTAIEGAVEETDLVLFSGGSSVGMRDLGEQAIERLGNPGILIHGVSLKPGKPVIIGLCNDTPVFGLPGHPVSAMVCFDFFVRPTILSLSGRLHKDVGFHPSVTAKLMRNINSAAGRLDVVRVTLTFSEGTMEAHPVLGKSGAISTLSQADGYFLIDEDCQGCNTEEFVEVYLYQ